MKNLTELAMGPEHVCSSSSSSASPLLQHVRAPERELTVLPVKVSGFLWTRFQDAVYWLSIDVRAGLTANVHVGCGRAVQTEMPLLGLGCPEIALAIGLSVIKKKTFVFFFFPKNRRNKRGEGESVGLKRKSQGCISRFWYVFDVFCLSWAKNKSC